MSERYDDRLGDVASTARLVERARAGDRTAVDDLLTRHIPPLTRWAHGRLPGCARELRDTDDLVQETVVRAFHHLDTFDARGHGALLAYLRQALLNRIRDELRRAGRQPAAQQLDPNQAADQPSPLDEAIGAEATKRYRAALARLGPDQQDLVVGRVEMGFTYEELARVTGKTSADAARMAVGRALAQLAREMGRE